MSGKSANETVARGGLVNALGTVIGVMQPLFLVFLGRGERFGLGPDVLGSFVLATTYLFLFVRLGVLGLDKGTLRHVPLSDAERPGDVGALASTLGTGLKVVTSVALAATLTLALLADRLVAFDGSDAVGDGAWWLFWMTLALPTDALAQYLLFAMRGRHRMAPFVLVRSVVVPGLMLAVAVPAAVLGWGKTSVVAGYYAGSLGGALVAWLAFRRTFPEVSFGSMVGAKWDKHLVSFSWPQGLTDLLNHLLARVDILMIGFFFPATPALAGAYAIASQQAGAVKKVRQAFDTSLAPVLAAQLGSGDIEGAKDTYARVSRWVFLLYLAVAGPLSLSAALVLWIVSPEYVGYWMLVPILVAARLVNAGGGPAQTALLMSGRSRLELFNNLSINIGNIALNVWLIAKWGPIGAAVATATSLTVFNLLRVSQVRRLVKLSPATLDVIRLSAAGGLASIVPVLIIWPDPTSVWRSGIAAVVYLAAYLVSLFVCGAAADLRAVVAALRKGSSKKGAGTGKTEANT